MQAFTSPEAVLLLVSTKNGDLWPWEVATLKVHNSQTPHHSAHVSESSLTKLITLEYETNSLRMLKKSDLTRGCDSWYWPKEARPQETRMHSKAKPNLHNGIVFSFQGHRSS